jgi:hypothetical protein
LELYSRAIFEAKREKNDKECKRENKSTKQRFKETDIERRRKEFID